MTCDDASKRIRHAKRDCVLRYMSDPLTATPGFLRRSTQSNETPLPLRRWSSGLCTSTINHSQHTIACKFLGQRPANQRGGGGVEFFIYPLRRCHHGLNGLFVPGTSCHQRHNNQSEKTERNRHQAWLAEWDLRQLCGLICGVTINLLERIGTQQDPA